MPFNELETQKIKNTIEAEYMAKRRPPAHIRAELDMGYRIEGQSVFLFEIRPNYLDKTEIMQLEFAKITFVKKQKIWKLYWMRQDLKWHRYDPLSETPSLENALAEVISDPYACFFG